MAQVKSSKAASQNARVAGKPKRRYRTADQWREIIEVFDRSNLTRTEFCKDHSIAVTVLSRTSLPVLKTSDLSGLSANFSFHTRGVSEIVSFAG